MLGRWPGLKGGQPARPNSGLSGYALPEAVRVGNARGVAGTRAAARGGGSSAPREEAKAGLRREGRALSIPRLSRRGARTPLAAPPYRSREGGGAAGKGRGRGRVGRAYPGPGPPGLPGKRGILQREGRGRGRGETVGHRGGA